MKRLVIVLAITASACSGSNNTPTTPTVQTPAPPPPISLALLLVPPDAAFDIPGCQAKIELAASVGLATQACTSFTGTLVNSGPGCATNVHGTTTVFASNNAQVGLGSFTYASTVKPGERIAYIGGAITIPTSAGWKYLSTPSWDNVRCP